MRPFRTPLLLLVLGFVACLPPAVIRDGVSIPYEHAATADLQLARERLAAGQPAQARRVLERMLRELPQSRSRDQALLLLGQVNLSLRDSERAVLAWRRLLEDHPRSRLAAQTSLQLAELYRGLGRPTIARQVVERAPFGRASADLRVRLYRLLADLARAEADYPAAVRALAFSLRDAREDTALFEIDLELEELIRDRLRDADLEALVGRVPRGPVRDRVMLELSRRAIARADFDGAIEFLDRLPQRLRPQDDAERARLMARAGAGERTVLYSLGIAIPLSGPYAAFGESVLRGVTLGLGLFDDPPGQYRLLVRDTAGDVERGRSAVRELAREGVSAVIGPMRSVVAAGAAPVAQTARMPLLALASREDLPLLGDFIFGLGLTHSEQVRTLVRYAIRERGHRRFAILYPKDAYGTTFKNLFWDEIERLGGRIVGVEGYVPDAVDVQAEIKKLIGLHYLSDEERELLDERDRIRRRPEANAERLAELAELELPPYIDFDALFMPDVAQRIGLILPQLRFFDVKDVTFLGPSEWNDEVLLEIAGRDARGAVFSDSFYAKSPEPRVTRFVSRFRSAYGSTPERFGALGYDVAMILREVIDHSGRISRRGLRTELLALRDFEGVSGLTSFDERGGSRIQLELLTVDSGMIRRLDELR